MNRLVDRRNKGKRPTKRSLLAKQLAAKRWKKEDSVDVSTIGEPTNLEIHQPQTSSKQGTQTSTAKFQTSLCTSQKKLSLFTSDNGDNIENEAEYENAHSEYILVHSSFFLKVHKGTVCASCGGNDLKTDFSQFMGFASKITVTCTSCGNVCSENYTSPRISCADSSRPPFEVNRRMVDTFLSLGKGHAGLEHFCMSMGMPLISISSYNTHLVERSRQNEVLRGNILKEAVTAVRQTYIATDPDMDKDGVIDITVSYDGTWQKRGFSSLHGIGIIIDVLTGLVIDYEIMSKYCGICSQKEKKISPTSEEYKNWYENHVQSGKCDSNYTGSSTAMEMTAAEILWKRTVERHKLRYTTVVSDGDAKNTQASARPGYIW